MYALSVVGSRSRALALALLGASLR
jgi:hypothetical protein